MRDALGLTEFDYKKIKIQQKIGNFFNSKCTLLVYMKYFGLSTALRLNRVKKNRIEWLDECYSILEEEFADFIKNYQFLQKKNSYRHKYIWVCWLQGEKSMPDVVKYCLKSVQKNAPDEAEVVLITSDNLKKYIEFPNFIYQRLKKGSLTMTHFSDLIRMALLKEYGGLWIDATVFVSNKIPQKYFERDLYSVQVLAKSERSQNPYYGGGDIVFNWW